MTLFRARRPRLAVLSLVLGLAGGLLALAGAGPATAASHTGDLLAKGPAGSAYTTSPMVSQVGRAGATVSFTVQVKNTGPTLAQYRLRLTDLGGAAPSNLYDGPLALRPLAGTTDGYYTRALTPGTAQTLTVKVVVPKTGFHFQTVLALYATDGPLLDVLYLDTERTTDVAGTSATDLIAKQGSQLPVGGGQDYQVLTAPTVTATGSAVFSLTLQNSSTAPSAIAFKLADAACGYTVTVKDGATNVTAAALAGTYVTPTLAAKGKRLLTVTVKSSATACTASSWIAQSGVPGQPWAHATNLLVNKAA